MTLPPDDFDYDDCLRQVRAGDKNAARALVDRLYPLVRRIVHARCPARLDAEDLMQEIFTLMFSRLDQYRGLAPFPHWVAGIAGRTCLQERRRAFLHRETRWTDLDNAGRARAEAAASGEDTDKSPRPVDAVETVRRLLARLGGRERFIVTLLDLEGRSVADVSSLTGWSPVRVRVFAWRVRRKLGELARQMNLHLER